MLTKKLIPIALVALLLGMGLAPGVYATIPTNKMLTIWMGAEDKDDYFARVQVSQDKIEILNNSFSVLLTSIEVAMNNDTRGPNGENITKEELKEIEASTYEFILLLNDTIGAGFPLLGCIELIGSVIGFLLGPFYFLRQPIFSIGYGVSVIPWYFYEMFIGKLFRPVWIAYLFGFTATFRINPFPPHIPFNRIGLHRLRSVLYNGLYIDFGDLGHDRKIGMVMLIGFGFTGMA
jgi:hypothetical protein